MTVYFSGLSADCCLCHLNFNFLIYSPDKTEWSGIWTALYIGLALSSVKFGALQTHSSDYLLRTSQPSPSLQRADKTAVSLAAVSPGLSLLLIQTLPLSPGSGAVTCSMGQGFDLNTRGGKVGVCEAAEERGNRRGRARRARWGEEGKKVRDRGRWGQGCVPSCVDSSDWLVAQPGFIISN